LTLVPARGRILTIAVLCVCLHVAEARADFLITPYLGSEFAASTTLLDLDTGAASAKHWTFGGSVAWLSDRILGVEADFAIVPGFLQNSTELVTGSRVTTLTGSVIAALPLSVTRDSLRPYAVGGLGLIHATAEDPLGLNESCSNSDQRATCNWLGLQLGAGAIGLITNRAGVRFDLRHFRALSRDVTLLGERTSKLSFWRATVGVTLRY
jgi:opacity protein-like surface antigen